VDKFLDGIHINPDKYINPYKFIPFVEVKANVHAISDISDVISLNDQLNVTLTFINEILKYQAFPMLGPKGNYTSDFPALSQQSLKDIEVSPRNIMPIPMERITSGGVDESVSRHIEQLEKDISIVSGVPIKLLTAELGGNMSGVALQRMMSNVVKQAEVRRNYITTAYKQVSNMVLQLLGKTDEVEIIWPEIIKIDLKDKLDEALKKQTLGISKETILSELGYDYDEENSKVQEEFDNSIEKRIIDEQQSLQPSPSRKSSQGNKLR
jgi:hypothetical protein